MAGSQSSSSAQVVGSSPQQPSNDQHSYPTASREANDENFLSSPAPPTETTALISKGLREIEDKDRESYTRNAKTTWRREARILLLDTLPVAIGFCLEYSLMITSVITVGRLGKLELGAASLATTTGNITGFAIFNGLAASLETLCSQAYGAGRKDLVGLYWQRMVLFEWLWIVPLGLCWYNAASILRGILPQAETAELTGLYLRILILGTPAFAVFECGKRFLQAQGFFHIPTAIAVVVVPLNAFLGWLFVWHLGWGFSGAPIAIVISHITEAVLLISFVYFGYGRDCWFGFTLQAFHNWVPMIKLALPGMAMVLAEFTAFETLTVAATYVSSTHLAAQPILLNTISMLWLPIFSLSIAMSTRMGQLIGAELPGPAKITAATGLGIGILVSACNSFVAYSLRMYIPRIYTDDQDVIQLAARTGPLLALCAFFDGISGVSNGLFRGLGFQKVGGTLCLFCYWVIGVPIALGTTFGWHWELFGLWTGPTIAQATIVILGCLYIYQKDWQLAVSAAKQRNARG